MLGGLPPCSPVGGGQRGFRSRCPHWAKPPLRTPVSCSQSGGTEAVSRVLREAQCGAVANAQRRAAARTSAERSRRGLHVTGETPRSGGGSDKWGKRVSPGLPDAQEPTACWAPLPPWLSGTVCPWSEPTHPAAPASLRGPVLASGERGWWASALRPWTCRDKLTAINPRAVHPATSQGQRAMGPGGGLGHLCPACGPAAWVARWGAGVNWLPPVPAPLSRSSGAQPIFVLSFWVPALWPEGG